MQRSIKIQTLDELSDLAQELIGSPSKNNIWTFYGSMGAGKTTLIKKLCEVLKVKEQVASPTFNLINEYETEAGQIVYHFDFYRLDSIEEALNIGTDEYFHSGNLCLLEWPDEIEPLLPENRRNIIIQATDDGVRIIKIEDYE